VPGRYVCLHPGARSRAKCWPPACFAAVADRLAEEYGVAIVLTGSGKESGLTAAVAARMRQPALDAAAPISIGAMAALMRGARLLVCNDTGVSHIAAGLGLPSVVVFSHAELERWAPLDRARHRCLRDPEGRQAAQVLQQARALLTAAGNA
jgi:ADP-heptose:LPS heptosyltransferase